MHIWRASRLHSSSWIERSFSRSSRVLLKELDNKPPLMWMLFKVVWRIARLLWRTSIKPWASLSLTVWIKWRMVSNWSAKPFKFYLTQSPNVSPLQLNSSKPPNCWLHYSRNWDTPLDSPSSLARISWLMARKSSMKPRLPLETGRTTNMRISEDKSEES